MKKHIALYLSIIILLVLSVIGILAYSPLRNQVMRFFFRPSPSMLPQDNAQTSTSPGSLKPLESSAPTVVAQNLSIPWEIVFLPSGEMLVTERPGTLRKVGTDGSVITIEGVKHRGEGGLLGMALHPNFTDNKFIYLYFTTATTGNLTNRIERYRYENTLLTDKKIILEGIPGAANHDGGRIAFGPDGMLYITTGDASNSDNAQNINSLAGKILRLNDDGSTPDNNPFHNATYSYGHRNPQGLAWDDQGRLWATEHGRSGLQSGYDELNLIAKGGNYGWPTIEGDEQKEGMHTPIINSGAKETWAPAGLVYWSGSMYFTGLRGESLYQAKITTDGKVEKIQAHLRTQFGRLRAVNRGPDGFLYISTSNTDGRGTVHTGDDTIIKFSLLP